MMRTLRCSAIRNALSTEDSSPVRGALVGCGFFSQNHMHAWRDLQQHGAVRGGVQIVAIVDPSEERRAITGDAFGIPEADRWASAAEMLADGSTKVEFLDIATQVDSHEELVGLAEHHADHLSHAVRRLRKPAVPGGGGALYYRRPGRASA